MGFLLSEDLAEALWLTVDVASSCLLPRKRRKQFLGLPTATHLHAGVVVVAAAATPFLGGDENAAAPSPPRSLSMLPVSHIWGRRKCISVVATAATVVGAGGSALALRAASAPAERQFVVRHRCLFVMRSQRGIEAVYSS